MKIISYFQNEDVKVQEEVAKIYEIDHGNCHRLADRA